MNNGRTSGEDWKYFSKLGFLILIAVILAARTVWLFLSDASQFPVNTVQVKASYRCVTHKQVQHILEPHLTHSFFSVSIARLRKDLLALNCIRRVSIEREWPDTLLIQVEEKIPFVRWNNVFMTKNGDYFSAYESSDTASLPQLNGPQDRGEEVLAMHKNLSKILSDYGLSASIVTLHENGAWELQLTNSIIIRLGKQKTEEKLMRFVKSYAALTADRNAVPKSIDLRYPRGMAVEWIS